MLALTPAALRLLAAHQEKWLTDKSGKQPPKAKPRRMNRQRFERAVDEAVAILRPGFPTKFEFEGACRHGFRSALCQDGWSWNDADATAAAIVAKALNLIGAVRPTWKQGQPEWTEEGFSPTERTWCANCGSRLPPSEQDRVYCSEGCRVSAYQKRAKISGERMSRAEYLATCAAHSERRRLDREIDCPNCGEPFITDPWRRKKYCSDECADAGRKATMRLQPEKPCASCGTAFPPRGSRDSRYCSRACAQVGRRVREERSCLTCRSVFTARPSEHKRFCSPRCAKSAAAPVSVFRCEEA